MLSARICECAYVRNEPFPCPTVPRKTYSMCVSWVYLHKYIRLISQSTCWQMVWIVTAGCLRNVSNTQVFIEIETPWKIVNHMFHHDSVFSISIGYLNHGNSIFEYCAGRARVPQSSKSTNIPEVLVKSFDLSRCSTAGRTGVMLVHFRKWSQWILEKEGPQAYYQMY